MYRFIDPQWGWLPTIVVEVMMFYSLLICMGIGKGRRRRIESALLGTAFLGMAVLLLGRQKYMFFSRVNFLGVLLAILLLTFAAFRRELRLIIGVTCIYYSFLGLMDSFFLSLIKIFPNTILSFSIRFDTEAVMLYAAVCSRIIMFFIIDSIQKENRKQQSEEIKNILPIVGIVLVILVLIYQRILEYLFFSTEGSYGFSSSNLRNTTLGLFMMVVIVGVMVVLLIRNKSIEQENLFLTMKEEMERQKYEELTESLEYNRELVHDTKNHYLVISEYERNGEYEKLHQYIEDIKKEFVKINPEIYTGNRILDLILGQKRAKAEQKGIAFELQTPPIGMLPFAERETCALFGNLLDNAIEACEKAEHEKKIQIKLEQRKHLFFVVIRNTIKEPPAQEGKRFLSSKQNRKQHGFGMKSIQRIVDKYEGIISYEVKEHTFRVALTFFNID